MTVTYDASCGYIGSVPGLRQPLVALSLGGLRRRVEAVLMPEAEVVDVRLLLDRKARFERDRRRRQAQAQPPGTNRSPTQVDLRSEID